MSSVEVSEVEFSSGDGTLLRGDRMRPADPVASAIVCHPHPRFGGSRRDRVVGALCRGLVEANHDVVRFDFRGAGDSEGSFADGRGEREDLLAAIAAFAPVDRPLVLAGYSFGADIALSVADPPVRSWLVVAPPLTVIDDQTLVAGTDARAVRMIAGDQDELAPSSHLAAVCERWTDAEVATVVGADHFFAAQIDEVSRLATRFSAAGGER